MNPHMTWMGKPVSDLTAGQLREAMEFVQNPHFDAPFYEKAAIVFYLGQRARELGLDPSHEYARLND